MARRQYKPQTGTMYTPYLDYGGLAKGGGMIQEADYGVNALLNAISSRNYQGVQNALGAIDRDLRPLAQQMAHEMLNFGGLTPQTRQQVATMTPEEGFTTDRDIKGIIARRMVNAFQTMAGQSAGVEFGPEGPNITLYNRPEDMSRQEFVALTAKNRALEFLDPTQRAQTQQALARANPSLFRAFSQVEAPTGGPAEMTDQAYQQRLTKASEAFDWDKLRQHLPGGVQTDLLQDASGQLGSPVQWMRDYLRTAARASGPDVTRSEQQIAAQQLQQLEGEGQNNPLLATARNIVNPLRRRASLSNIIGQGGAQTNPVGNYRRGGFSLRNVSAL